MTDTAPALAKIELPYLNTPKKDRARIERARKAAIADILARHLPGVELRYWTPRDGRTFNYAAALSRVYLNRDGERIGFVGVRRSARRPEGGYESHRWTKGEDHYHSTFERELPDPLFAALQAAVREYLARTDELHRYDDADQFEFSYARLAENK